MDGWNTSFLLGWPIFRCYVSFKGCISFGQTYFIFCIYFSGHKRPSKIFWQNQKSPGVLKQEDVELLVDQIHDEFEAEHLYSQLQGREVGSFFEG